MKTYTVWSDFISWCLPCLVWYWGYISCIEVSFEALHLFLSSGNHRNNMILKGVVEFAYKIIQTQLTLPISPKFDRLYWYNFFKTVMNNFAVINFISQVHCNKVVPVTVMSKRLPIYSNALFLMPTVQDCDLLFFQINFNCHISMTSFRRFFKNCFWPY